MNRQSRRTVDTFTIFLLTMLPLQGVGRTILVPEDYGQIHIAVEFAHRGDTVLVAPGTYNESVRLRSVDFVVGSYLLTTGNPAYIDETIIDGSGTGSPVIRADGGAAGSPLLRGFTVTGGMTDYGGGIICRDSTRPVFEDLNVVNNEAESMGGGAYCYYKSTPTFRRVNFIGNRAGGGGGVAEYEAQSTFDYCSIRQNTADNVGGLYSYMSKPILTNCQIGLNTPGNLNFSYSHPELLRVTIDNGQSEFGSVFVRGGLGGEATTFDRVTFYSSMAEGVEHLRVVGSVRDFILPEFNLFNCIVRGNSDQMISFGDGGIEITANINNSNIEGERNAIHLNGRASLEWGEHNFDAEPQFISPEQGDFGLEEGSPCIDAGDEDADPDPDNSRADLGGIPFGGFPVALFGNVSDSRFGQPVNGAEVILQRGDERLLQVHSNMDGNWTGVMFQKTLLWRSAEVLIRAPESRNAHGSIHMVAGGLFNYPAVIETHPFQLSREDFTAEIGPGYRYVGRLNIWSNSNDPILWTMSVEESDSINGGEWDFNSLVTITPNSGELPGGRGASIDLHLTTQNEEGDTVLVPGQYFAQARLSVVDYYSDIILPIAVTIQGMGIAEETMPLPQEFSIAAFPQPFNSELTIDYILSKHGDISFEMVDLLGRSKWERRYGDRDAGEYRETVDFTSIPAGVYLLKAENYGSIIVRKVVCVK